MIFRLIEAKKAEHAISRLCSVLGVTRAGYYAWRSRRPCRRERADQELSGLVGRVFVESLETYGAPRVHAELREAHGVRVGRKSRRPVDAPARAGGRLAARQASTHDDP